MGSEKVYRDYSSCSSWSPFCQPATIVHNQRTDRQTEYYSIKCPPDDLLLVTTTPAMARPMRAQYCSGMEWVAGRQGLWLAIAHNYL